MSQKAILETVRNSANYTKRSCNSVYGCGSGLRGPVGVGWCACDKTNIIKHVVHANLVGL